MRKAILEKRMARLKEKLANMKARALASEDVNEVRSINEQMEDINADIEYVQAELDEIANEERSAQAQTEERQTPPANAQRVNGQIAGSFAMGATGIQTEERQTPPANAQRVNGQIAGSFAMGATGIQTRENTDPFGSMEYREAFKRYVQTGAAIPENLARRDGMPANTNTLGATIPTTVLNEFINEIRKVYGNLYSKVRKLNIQGAVKVPIAQLQATFKWITEDTVAPREDGGTINQFVMFEYNMAEIRISQTLLSSIVTIDLFEREIVRVMLIAYLQAMDTAIVNGTGVGQPLGILNDPRVTATNNVVTFTAAQLSNWTYWRKSFFAKLPLGYRSGEFIFPLGTVDAYLETMADANNNPIFRQATGLEVNDGDSRNPNGRFFGRDISLVEPEIITDFDSANTGDVIGIYWQPEEYAINTNMEFGMRRWFDEDRNEWVNKMLTVVDGKVLNPMGYWILKKA